METLLTYRFGWMDLLLAILALLGLHAALQVTLRVLRGTATLRRFSGALMKGLELLRTLFEPVAILIIASVFLLIDPPLHGLLLAIILVMAFPHLRNYLNGRLVRVDNAIAVGKVLRSGAVRGRISFLGRLGLNLQTNEGLHYLSYTRLLSDGYTLISGEELGGYYHLEFRPESAPSEKMPARLMDLLATTPYLDWNHRPEFLPTGDQTDRIEVRVVLREDYQLYEFLELTKEWGFACSVLDGR